jgi:hypothetical protein
MAVTLGFFVEIEQDEQPAFSGYLEMVETKDGDPMPVGLFVPSAKAWKAVNEFMDRGGELPNGIECAVDSDIPTEAFPR